MGRGSLTDPYFRAELLFRTQQFEIFLLPNPFLLPTRQPCHAAFQSLQRGGAFGFGATNLIVAPISPWNNPRFLWPNSIFTLGYCSVEKKLLTEFGHNTPNQTTEYLTRVTHRTKRTCEVPNMVKGECSRRSCAFKDVEDTAENID